jgi:hypothetical protein
MNAGTILKGALPWIGAAVTGNYAALASMAIGKVNEALGTKAQSAGEVEAAVLGATPDQMAALKKLDDDFAAQMQQMNFTHVEDLYKLGNDDVADARNRQVQLKDKFVPWFASLVTAAACAAIFAVLTGKAKVESALAGTLVGYLAANMNQIVSYFFGSSAAHDAASRAALNTTSAK